ncbi:MAG: ATP-binding protein [Pirellulales bacterium]
MNTQIQDAKNLVISELASGIQMGPAGFEVVQKYPVRVITEAITNAVIHRDYRIAADIHIRIFADRIEVESPGFLIGPVTAANISRIGTHCRNPMLVSHLREFPSPPNLDAGEGVRMMFGTMHDVGLYPPIYLTKPRVEREAVTVWLLNENRPTAWEQVSQYVEKNYTVSNAEVRQLLGTTDVLATSRQIKGWVDAGVLVVTNPHAAKRLRRYTKPEVLLEMQSFSFESENELL